MGVLQNSQLSLDEREPHTRNVMVLWIVKWKECRTWLRVLVLLSLSDSNARCAGLLETELKAKIVLRRNSFCALCEFSSDAGACHCAVSNLGAVLPLCQNLLFVKC